MWTLLGLLTILVVKASANISAPIPLTLAEMFMAFRIVPEIIPDAPKTPLIDIFGDYKADLGNRIPVCAAVRTPYTVWSPASENILYTLIAINPDYPEYFSSNGTQFLYGLTVNVPGTNIAAGNALSPYISPAPLPGSGDNRYICVIFRQSFPIPVDNQLLISVSRNIRTFSILDFIMRYKLGTPVAGNFFRSRQSFCDPSTYKDTDDCCNTECII